LPLFGWIYAFFDYRPGFDLAGTPFAGFKYFTSMVANSVLRDDVFRVLRNTFALSGLGILTSFLPMFFAIALSELRGSAYRRIVQTITTVPNFLSWVLVYSLAFVLLSVNDGVVNSLREFIGIGRLRDTIVPIMWGRQTPRGVYADFDRRYVCSHTA
jgi:putative aldouronate transport system permease protein